MPVPPPDEIDDEDEDRDLEEVALDPDGEPMLSADYHGEELDVVDPDDFDLEAELKELDLLGDGEIELGVPEGPDPDGLRLLPPLPGADAADDAADDDLD